MQLEVSFFSCFFNQFIKFLVGHATCFNSSLEGSQYFIQRGALEIAYY